MDNVKVDVGIGRSRAGDLQLTVSQLGKNSCYAKPLVVCCVRSEESMLSA